MKFRSLLTPRWIITTLLVLAAVAVMVRLGFWQLDRLEQRRSFNARVLAQAQAAPLDLNSEMPQDPQALYEMEYRKVTARGTFNPDGEVLLRNQAWEGQPGYHLVTPLRLEGSGQVLLVDRGFIPLADGAPEVRAKYAAPGIVEVSGILRRPVVPRYFGAPDPTPAPGEMRLDAWNVLRLERIAEQLGTPLPPVYILAAPETARQGPPYASIDEPDLSEGSHLSYALQWFSFSAILAVGYPFFIRKNLKG